MLLAGRSITKAFGARVLFEGVTLGVDARQRLGLIGPNGAGKSTLLRILAGLDPPDGGQVLARRGLTPAYVPQSEATPDAPTVQRAVADGLADRFPDDTDRLTRAAIALTQAGFTDLDQPPAALSGGWAKRLSIVRRLAREPDVLLLDEPTNHLDLEGILWLERFLAGSSFAAIVVTHDRAFLQNAVTRIAEVCRAYPGGVFAVDGGYAEFTRRRAQFLEGQRSTQQALQARVRLDDRYLARAAKARATQRKATIDAAAQRRDELAAIQHRNAPLRAAAVEFEATQRQTRKLLAATNLSKSLGGRTLFARLDLTLAPNTCTAIAGYNGSGKTTLIRTLTGGLPPDTGTLKQADGLRVVTFTQNRADLDLTQTLQQALCPVGDRIYYRDKEIHVTAWARRFLFHKSQLNVPVGDLSGGEQARILIANLMMQPADVLVLDEPTNDLDIPSLEVLEESLADFPGAVVLVTHDRVMLDRLATTVLGLDGRGGVREYATLEQWQRHMATLEQADTPKAEKREKPRSSPARKLSYKDQRELDGMEQAILDAEQRVADLEQRAADPAVLADHEQLTAVCRELDAAHLEVRRLYERWSELEEMQASLS